jgi:Arc/MetJ-type ribon-helix-helix transcriptional regulator
MSSQINLKLSSKMLAAAKLATSKGGFESIQDFIRATLREKLFERGYDNSFTEKEIKLIDELIDKSLKRGKFVSEEEYKKALK